MIIGLFLGEIVLFLSLNKEKKAGASLNNVVPPLNKEKRKKEGSKGGSFAE
jgi:hypothetical protein